MLLSALLSLACLSLAVSAQSGQTPVEADEEIISCGKSASKSNGMPTKDCVRALRKMSYPYDPNLVRKFGDATGVLWQESSGVCTLTLELGNGKQDYTSNLYIQTAAVQLFTACIYGGLADFVHSGQMRLGQQENMLLKMGRAMGAVANETDAQSGSPANTGPAVAF